jgi:hypothetical protein
VNKNGEGILDPENPLTCYHLSELPPHRIDGHSHTSVLVDNQFGQSQLTLSFKYRKLLCVPSTKAELP